MTDEMTTTEIVTHNKEPFVATLDKCLTQKECEHMIRISKPSMKKSLVSFDKIGVESSGRTSQNTWIQHDHDEITKSIGEKIAKIVGMPLENAEAFQVIYYDTCAEYQNHYDSWEHDGSEKTLRCMKYGGARLKTALVYLNDVDEGGSTRMTRLNIDVLPKLGKLLIFENTYTGTNVRHPLSKHAGMPVIKGEKYVFNVWFKECHSKKLYSEFNSEYYHSSCITTTNKII
jgi:prolyl 4-hydroxylase